MKTWTATIQIGNSDDKLTQKQWAQFIGAVDDSLMRLTIRFHFRGQSPGDAAWQNACWVVEIEWRREQRLKKALATIAAYHGQDAIAYTLGRTQFVGPR